MMRWHGSALLVLFFCFSFPLSALAATGSNSEGLYNFLVVWAPLILMGAWFIYILGKQRTSQKKSFEYMERTEKLLERIANAVEQNRK